ncbi:RING finger protein 145-like [Thalassophryne amazonica]|uniref:RING finger protein 145-like n=1 Tax=Thalassophryne amazonica TaxID=390379 RepID=UPI00147093A9|nr:RING finger protein 145-like [Thalassophryne amazonica]
MNGKGTAGHQGIMFFLLTSVSECCATPYSLLGLTFMVSYLALGLLNLCKFYLGGYAAVQNENVMHRGVTEGVTLLLLALQTGLLDMQALQRTFLLSIILFIVVTSTLQSMIEITDPVILALGASRNRSVWKHFRGLSMCLLLLVFPVFMAYKISQFFHMDFWLLILVSSCMLTSLQVTGTLLIYSLFMMEMFRSDPIESLDEVIYWVNAVSRVLEFMVALCVVAYGTWESLFGEWSWMGASVIIIHSYFNVWLRAQSGWRSFLLRQEAAKKINSLPRATAEQLHQYNDVCSICFEGMNSAVITYCGHFFHGNCLRKWLYVQETCPMCHQTVRPTPSGQTQASRNSPAAAAAPQSDAEPDPTTPEEDHNPDSSDFQKAQSERITPVSMEQQKSMERLEGDSEELLAEPESKAVQGHCFSSSGASGGSVSPESSCPPKDTSHCHEAVHGVVSCPLNVQNSDESSKEESGDVEGRFQPANVSQPSVSDAVCEHRLESQSRSEGAGLCASFEDGTTSSTTVLQTLKNKGDFHEEETKMAGVDTVNSEFDKPDTLCENGSDLVQTAEEMGKNQMVDCAALNNHLLTQGRDIEIPEKPRFNRSKCS